jgi:hypothetical protein
MTYLKNLDKLCYALPLLSVQFKLPQAMISNARELVDISLQVDKGGQVVKCGVPAGRNVTRECALVESSRCITLQEGVPLREKERWGVDNFEGDAACLLIFT